ncbi:MAG: transporter [Bacteroidia bacterium]|nr:transporter [Bacteroidia bacterium]
MKWTFLVLGLFLFGTPLSGQYNKTIRSIRPGQATGTYTIGKRVFQMQPGVQFRSFDDDGLDRNSTVAKTVLRYGILERFEISGVIQYSDVKTMINDEESSKSGISNTQIGARINLLDAAKDPIALAFQGRILLTLQDKAFQRNNIGSKWVVSAARKIAPKLALLLNYSLTWSGNGGDPNSSYAVRLKRNLSPRINAVVEMYGGLGNFTTSYDAGIDYFFNDDFKLDLSSGFLAGEVETNWFIDLGFSWRTDWRA